MENPVVVIGSGIAGLNFALKAAKFRKVVVLTKMELKESATFYAQGGIASVINPEDSFESHIKDTIKAGANHNKIEAVELIINEGPKAVADLIEYGVDFQRAEKGVLALTREGGHSANRIVYVGDYTGKEVEKALIAKLRECKNVKIIEYTQALDLKVAGNGVAGVWYEVEGKICFIASNEVVLATGGIGQLYEHTTNPKVLTGDGIAMALRAGAETEDMEFVQFHPTVFMQSSSGNPFLISEAVRGEGAYLVDLNENRFVDELFSRDIVARAIFEKLKTGSVYLDCRHMKQFGLRFPTIEKELQLSGLDVRKDLIPVVPAAHYLCGGIKTDLNGCTNVAGLYAIGECACTGLHGANRLASNSLLEGAVISNKLAEFLQDKKAEVIVKTVADESLYSPVFEYIEADILSLQKLMLAKVGIVRSMEELREMQKYIVEQLKKVKMTKAVSSAANWEYYNMLQVGLEIVKAALKRDESLGCHFID
jgi:L-aspartate oxidase